MAGAGKKTFVPGDVLTAAQVNDYLMDQSVMRFSGSAARAASITAPTEGMVTYLDNTNRLYIYDGAAWQEIGMEADDVRNLISASGQIIVGTAAGSVTSIPLGNNGEVLHVDVTASAGVAWKVVEAGGAATYFQVAASGVTSLPSALPGGFYRISTSTTSSWSDTQWRFVDTDGNLYGVTITGGAGFVTIPVTVASLNLTTASAAPFTVLVEEISGVTATLLDAPTVTSFDWQTVGSGSIVATTASLAASIGSFDVTTGKFNNLGPASVRTASIATLGSGTLNASYNVVVVQSNPTGVWSTGSAIKAPAYPFQYFTANGTYVAPPWSASADILVVSGGGGGATYSPTPAGHSSGGGGGAGGASVFTNRATPGSISVTVGAGGGVGGSGNSSSFGSFSTTGGGRGVSGAAGNGIPGGSGGGGAGVPAGVTAGTGGTGVTGQGNPGGAGAVSTPSRPAGGGGGFGSAGAPGSVSIGAQSGGSGSVVWGVSFGGGGGGGNASGSPTTLGPAGGPGGGGRGSSYHYSGTAGTAYTGGGGGGGSGRGPGATYQARNGRAGGAGFVIVRAR